MTIRTVPVDAIVVGERDRIEFGDIAALASSIKAVGLLHPVVVTNALTLVAGGRRLAAVQQLGWPQVPVTEVDLATAADVLRAEADENTCRKPLTPYEASRARERRARVLAEDAARRKAQAPGRPRGERQAVSSSNLEEQKPSARETRNVAAVGTGYSASTLDKVDRLRDAAERGLVRRGKTEVPAPPEVVEVAKHGLEGVKESGAAVDSAAKSYAAAVERYLAADPDMQKALLRKATWQAMRRAGDLPKLSAPHVAAVCHDDMWDSLAHLQQQINDWVAEVAAHRPKRLTLVKGEHA